MSTNTRTLEIAYRYRGFDYLVADKKGNLFLLPHFRFRRTVYFKQLEPFVNGNKKAIKHHGSNISFKQLKGRKIKTTEVVVVY